MSDLLLGLVLVLVGCYLCLNGLSALRVLLALWGALIGFVLGAGTVTAITGDGFLSTALGWLVGVVLGLVLAAIAYLYFAIAVLLSVTSAGFALGGGLASAMGASAPWLLVLGGLVVGVAFGVFAVVANLPRVILVVASSVVGASALVTGVMLVFGVRERGELASTDFHAADHPWWYAAFLAAALVGVLVQSLRAPAEVPGWGEPAHRK